MIYDEIETKLANAAKNVGSGITGATVGLGCVSAAGVSGLSGVGIMTGLATLGVGSAAAGIIVTGGIAIGTAVVTKKLLKFIFG